MSLQLMIFYFLIADGAFFVSKSHREWTQSQNYIFSGSTINSSQVHSTPLLPDASVPLGSSCNSVGITAGKSSKEACWLEEISSDFIPIFSRCFISRLTDIDSQLQKKKRLQLIPFSLQLPKTAKGKCPMAIAYVFGC